MPSVASEMSHLRKTEGANGAASPWSFFTTCFPALVY